MFTEPGVGTGVGVSTVTSGGRDSSRYQHTGHSLAMSLAADHMSGVGTTLGIRRHKYVQGDLPKDTQLTSYSPDILATLLPSPQLTPLPIQTWTELRGEGTEVRLPLYNWAMGRVGCFLHGRPGTVTSGSQSMLIPPAAHSHMPQGPAAHPGTMLSTWELK